MIHKLIRLVEEFKEFRKVQHSVKSIELSNTHKNMILSYNKDFEKELNSLIIRNLSDSMIEGDISPEYIRGFKSALVWRISYISYKTKYN